MVERILAQNFFLENYYFSTGSLSKKSGQTSIEKVSSDLA